MKVVIVVREKVNYIECYNTQTPLFQHGTTLERTLINPKPWSLAIKEGITRCPPPIQTHHHELTHS